MTAPERPITEHELHAYIDERLWPARQLEVENYLDTQPELARRVTAYRAQRAALRSAFAAQSEEPLPSKLDLTGLIESRLRQRHGWRRTMGVAVLTLCVGVAAGWYLHLPTTPNRTQLAVSLLQQEAINSHTVYASDRRHPIEVSAAEQDHLSQWLSNRLNRTVEPPDLSRSGYRLLGGRLLATERGAAAALFMYDDAQGNRLSLLMRPMAQEISAERSDMSRGAVNLCAWIKQGIGYAIVAETPDEALDDLAQEISGRTHEPG
jgi:anti-sigma factor RsiW